MEKDIKRKFNFLKVYSGLLTVVVIVGFLTAFKQINSNPHFKEIDVERINIVEKDGKLKMVISNDESQHPGIVDGKVLPPRKRHPGIIFFNDDGDECGGLGFGGDKNGAGMVYSVDQYQNDQIMQLQYSQQPDSDQKLIRSYGVKMWDRPDNFTLGRFLKVNDSLKKLNNKKMYYAELEKMETKGLLGKERLFLGKTTNNDFGLFLRDDKGQPRIKIYIDRHNRAVLEALDDHGKEIGFRNKN